MNYLVFVFFAIIPSFVWLLFFLRKDKDPESKKVVLLVFTLGGGAALLAGLVQSELIGLLDTVAGREFNLVAFLLYHLIIIALIEELLKYFTVRFTVINHREFDEPVDAMIYMITAALGFAAVENFVYLIRHEGLFGETIIHYSFYLSSLRFLGATLLHALSSAVLGFFMALSFWKTRRSGVLTLVGILAATILHATYNLFIISSAERGLIFSSVFLLFLAIFIIYYAFSKVKKLKSICEI